MQTDSTLSPLQWFVFRYQPLLVLVMGFAGAFLLGLLLLDLTGRMQVDAGQTVGKLVEPAAPTADSTSLGDGQDSTAVAVLPTDPALSPVFTAEVRRWEPQIMAWAAEFGFDPNLVATIMQIESCGNPQAVSSAGAQGLFQVMPFHFAEGEQMTDPDTNARRGLAYLQQSLDFAEGHVGMALAGYNGGHVAVQGSWESWSPETRRYYRWGNGIYSDAISGLTDSPTLHDWLEAGGGSLCVQAAGQTGL